MTLFVENINQYLHDKKIKQSYVALKSGMTTQKLSRLLLGKQSATEEDINRISRALGYTSSFFLDENFKLPVLEYEERERFALYCGDMPNVDKRIVDDCIDFLESIHSVLGLEQELALALEEELKDGY